MEETVSNKITIRRIFRLVSDIFTSEFGIVTNQNYL